VEVVGHWTVGIDLDEKVEMAFGVCKRSVIIPAQKERAEIPSSLIGVYGLIVGFS
jgi:hypothetical protein